MLEIPKNTFIPRNQEERRKIEIEEKKKMDLFQEKIENELGNIKIIPVENVVPNGIFPISQKCSEYSNLPYGKIGTIKSSACGALALEYAFRVNGYNLNFKELIWEIVEKGYRGYIFNDVGKIVDGCGTEYSLFDSVAVRVENLYEIVEHLRTSMICILVENEIYHQDETRKGNHFINLIGIDQKQNAIFMDGNQITNNGHPEEAVVKKKFNEIVLGFRCAWVWEKEKMKRCLK